MAKTDRRKADRQKTDRHMLDDHELEAFFKAARVETAAPSDALMAAILDDAAMQQARADVTSVPSPDILSVLGEDRRAGGFWADLRASVGGWPALAGMATATIVGVWIGFAAPTRLEAISGGLVLSGDYSATDETYALEDLAPGYLGADVLMEDEG